MAPIEYDAFVSYRRSDGTATATWLRRELQGFRLPRSLRSAKERQLRIYLDTAYERGTSDFYEQSIRPALMSSRYLLVVATPDAVLRTKGEDWIAREIADFTSGPNARNTIAVRGAGDFNGPLPADLIARFPNIEIVDLRGAGRFWYFNPATAGRLSSEKLKLVAPLLDLPPAAMPQLRQEEERRQQARLGLVSGTAFAVLTAISTTSILALQANIRAGRALEDSMFATGRMVITANDPSGDTKSSLLNQGCDLLDRLGDGAPSKPGLHETLICAVERARAHEKLGETENARALLRNTLATIEQRYAATPRQNLAMRLTEALDAIVQFEEDRKDDGAAEIAAFKLRDRILQLTKTHDDARDLKTAHARAEARIGELRERQRNHVEAETHFVLAGEIHQSMAKETHQSIAAEQLSRAALQFRLAAEQRIKLGDLAAAVKHIDRSLSASGSVERPWRTPARIVDEARVRAMGAMMHRELGNPEFETHRRQADALLAPLLKSPKVDQSVRDDAIEVKRWMDDTLKIPVPERR